MEIKFALAQMNVTSDKKTNLDKARRCIEVAAYNGAKVVILPECFNCPYHDKFLEHSSENIPDGETCQMMSNAARQNNIFVLGSMAEMDHGNRYNTCPVFDPSGFFITKHRKMFMAITDVQQKMTFDESKIFTPGTALTTFGIKTDDATCQVGVGICRDVRYPELAVAYRDLGCDVIVYPGAFAPGIGEDHYELLHRSRALDSQVYVAAVCPARDEQSAFVAYGHSTMVDPWGKTVVTAGATEEIVYGNVDLEYLREVRRALPISRTGENYIFSKICLLR